MKKQTIIRTISTIAVLCSIPIISTIANDPQIKTLDKREMCLNAVQYEIGAYTITLNPNDLTVVNGNLKGTFKDLSERSFAFECNLNDQKIYYITPKAEK